MILIVNMLIGWRSDATPPTPVVERILWMSSSGTDVATFAIEHPAALPTMQRYDDIVAALATGQAQVLEHDPYAPRDAQRDDSRQAVKEKQKTVLKKRHGSAKIFWRAITWEQTVLSL